MKMALQFDSTKKTNETEIEIIINSTGYKVTNKKKKNWKSIKITCLKLRT
jgi:hypothetical protein